MTKQQFETVYQLFLDGEWSLAADLLKEVLNEKFHKNVDDIVTYSQLVPVEITIDYTTYQTGDEVGVILLTFLDVDLDAGDDPDNCECLDYDIVYRSFGSGGVVKL